MTFLTDLDKPGLSEWQAVFWEAGAGLDRWEGAARDAG